MAEDITIEAVTFYILASCNKERASWAFLSTFWWLETCWNSMTDNENLALNNSRVMGPELIGCMPLNYEVQLWTTHALSDSC